MENIFYNFQYWLYLGIWADEEGCDDSDNEPSGFGGRRRKDKKHKQNYTAPVSFVAGGIQQSGKNKKEIKAEENNDDETNNLNGHISTSRFTIII